MREHTPTTEGIRRAYATGATGMQLGYRQDEFDRWLRSHDAATRSALHVVPCARCGQRSVVASDPLNSDLTVCGDCGVQIGLTELEGLL